MFEVVDVCGGLKDILAVVGWYRSDCFFSDWVNVDFGKGREDMVLIFLFLRDYFLIYGLFFVWIFRWMIVWIVCYEIGRFFFLLFFKYLVFSNYDYGFIINLLLECLVLDL